jgi:predicted secreted protein
MSGAISSVGTKFYRWPSTSDNWAALSEILSLEGPTQTRETIDVTNLDSTGGYREFIGSFRDGGTVTLSMNFLRANYDLLHTDFEDDTPGNYKIVLPDTANTTIEFEGLVQEMPLSASVGNQVTANVTIKVTGEPLVYDDSSGVPVL